MTEGPRLHLEPVAELAQVEGAAWDRLALQCANVFATREWVTTWWEAFGTRGDLLSFTCHDRDDRLVALLPMYIGVAGTRRELRFLGNGLADRLGPVCAPGDRRAVADALRQAIYENRGAFDEFVGEDLPVQEQWGDSLGARSLGRTSSPVIHAEGLDWNAFVAARSAHFRRQVRWHEQRLIREHGLRYRLATDAARLASDMDALFRLHEARWSRTSSFTGDLGVFHRNWAAKALARGWLRLWIAELDGRPAAAWYGFRYGNSEWYYQAGRDPRYERLSVGSVLLAHTIRSALDDGVREYRFLRGDEPYKQRFADGDAPLETVALSSSEVTKTVPAGVGHA